MNAITRNRLSAAVASIDEVLRQHGEIVWRVVRARGTAVNHGGAPCPAFGKPGLLGGQGACADCEDLFTDVLERLSTKSGAISTRNVAKVAERELTEVERARATALGRATRPDRDLASSKWAAPLRDQKLDGPALVLIRAATSSKITPGDAIPVRISDAVAGAVPVDRTWPNAPSDRRERQQHLQAANDLLREVRPAFHESNVEVPFGVRLLTTDCDSYDLDQQGFTAGTQTGPIDVRDRQSRQEVEFRVDLLHGAAGLIRASEGAECSQERRGLMAAASALRAMDRLGMGDGLLAVIDDSRAVNSLLDQALREQIGESARNGVARDSMLTAIRAVLRGHDAAIGAHV